MRATAMQIETTYSAPSADSFADAPSRSADGPGPAGDRDDRARRWLDLRPTPRPGRRAPVAVALLALAGILAAGPGVGRALADPPSLSVVNASSTPVAQVHVSPDYATTWGNNRLAGTLPPGGRQDIAVDDRPDHCYYDVQITDAAGKQRAYWNQNLCTRPSFEYRGE